MNISSVALRIGVALEPHTRNFIRSEVTICRNDLWAQGYSRFIEEEIIESVLQDLYIERDTVDQWRDPVELSQLDAL
jgi:hypothetical protein